ncbi:anthranilate synthase alpha subunit 2, chloroplastic isoform X1 [Capsicum chacoense]
MKERVLTFTKSIWGIIHVFIFIPARSCICMILNNQRSCLLGYTLLCLVAKENMVTIVDHFEGSRTEEFLEDPMINPHKIMEKWKPQCIDELPEAFCEQKHALLTKIASVREVVIGALLRAVLKQLVTRTVPPNLG